MTHAEGTDAHRLRGYVEAWHAATEDAAALLRSLGPDDWERPTDLPGWNVRYVASHLAHLESELAGNPPLEVEVPEAPHITGLMGQYTERGPLARAGWETERIIEEFEQSVAARYAELTAHPPEDASAPGPGFAGLIGWSWETLLSNRVVDVWMHEQDIRRAVDRPGSLDTPGARHTAGVFARALPYVLAKRVAAPPGTSAVLEVSGAQQLTVAAAVRDDGRGTTLAEPPEEPTVTLGLDFLDWVVLAGGRRTPDQVQAKVDGDEELGRTMLASMAVTP